MYLFVLTAYVKRKIIGPSRAFEILGEWGVARVNEKGERLPVKCGEGVCNQ